MLDPSEASAPRSKVALLGYCLPAMEALDAAGHEFIAVVPSDFEPYMVENEIEYEVWDFRRYNENSGELANRLMQRGVGVAVPLFEETVEWAGALNGRFRDDPRLFTRYLLFRDKAMMKRRAQMSGIRVGVFEEADSRADVERFVARVNSAMTKIDGDVEDPIHLKPIAAAGSVGHRVIRKMSDVQAIHDDEFPCLLETHLDGQEFSCEVFVHDGKIRFLNITEYVRLGHSNFCPASPALAAHRPLIQHAVQELIKAFDVRYGMIHPEFFITPDGKINFGEVAARVPGGHIFDLIEAAYGFSPYVGFALCADPQTTEAELEEFFPHEDDHQSYAGSLMVYPRQKIVTRVDVPDRLLRESYYVKHNLFQPATVKVAERAGFGDHYGTIYFSGPDATRMTQILRDYESVDFYTADRPQDSNADRTHE